MAYPPFPTARRLVSGAALAAAAMLLGLALAAPARADLAAGWQAYQAGEFAAAMREWRPLAEAGDARAQFNLGVLYDEGRGVAIDRSEALKWWRKAAAQGHRRAQHNIALLLIAEDSADPARTAEAVEWLKRAAAAGFARSQYTLGKMVEAGLGLAADPVRAAQLIAAAARAGFFRAQYNMGKLARDGRGVPQDEAQAAAWFAKAAQQGYAKAQSHYGSRLAAGTGVARDPVQALKWMILAAAQGHREAAENRAALARTMSPESVAEAERLADAFRAIVIDVDSQ